MRWLRVSFYYRFCAPACCADKIGVFLFLPVLVLSLLSGPVMASGSDGVIAMAVPMTAPIVTVEPEAVVTPVEPEVVATPTPGVSGSIPASSGNKLDCISRDNAGRFMGWVDHKHCIFSGRTLASANWFDDLFGDWQDDSASVLVHIISEATFAESENPGPGLGLRVRASADLPNAKRRLRLVVTDDSERDESVAGQDVLSQLNRTSTQVSAALRFIPFDKAGFKSDFDLGVRGIGPPDFFARARVRNHWNISPDAIIRFGQTFRYGSDSDGRSISQLDVEQVLDENSVVRISSGYEYDQKNSDNGFNWGHGISMSHVLAAARSLGYGISLNGHTTPNWRGENYGPWIVFRSSFLRPWLFYELEPRLTWYRDKDWDSVASIVLRLEVQLGNK